MSEFDLVTNAVCIGDPVIGLVRYEVNLQPGRYTLASDAIRPSSESDAQGEGLGLIDLDGPYLYVIDASKADDFQKAFHVIGNECSYMMMEMEDRHEELEEKAGTKIAFYWEADLTSECREGQYVLDVAKIKTTGSFNNKLDIPQAAMSWAWLARNILQVCEGGLDVRTMYLATVVSHRS
jgi:hypothetical protein